MRTDPQSEPLQSGFKRWLTAEEIAAERLPCGPGSESEARAFIDYARRHRPRSLWRERREPIDGGNLARDTAPVELHYAALPLDAVIAYEARYRAPLAASKPSERKYARLGTGVLSIAEGGRVRAFLIQRLTAEPRLSAFGVRGKVRERFGGKIIVIAQGLPTYVPLPSLRLFQHYVQALRETGAVDAHR